MDAIWCACGETFDGEEAFRVHRWALSRDKHHKSRTIADTAPILPGGTVRTACHTTDMRLVTAVVAAEKVKRYNCGCWMAKTTRPGPDMPSEYACRTMEVPVAWCMAHADGAVPPTVLTRGG